MLELQSRSNSPDVGPAIRHGGCQWSVAAGWVGLIWYTVVVAVCMLGYFQLYFSHHSDPAVAFLLTLAIDQMEKLFTDSPEILVRNGLERPPRHRNPTG